MYILGRMTKQITIETQHTNQTMHIHVTETTENNKTDAYKYTAIAINL